MTGPLDQASPLNTRSSSGDALLTQRKLAHYLVEERSAHYVFTAKDNQPSIAEAIRLPFENRGVPDYSEPLTPTHGRIESRSIWTSTALNDYLDFPFVGQAFAIQRHTINKKTGKETHEMAYGLTSDDCQDTSVSLPRDRFWDIQVSKIDSPTR
ncbi:hypothetical protein, partial [Thiolapillus sp.]